MAIDKPRQRAPSGTQLEAGILGKSLEFLKALVSNPSPSGYEQPVAREYRPYSETFADELSIDVLGNVTAVLNPQAKSRVVLLAHMDEVGFIIHFISDEGLLYFSPIGGHDSVVPAGQRVWVHGRGKTTGVIGRAEFNLMTSEKKDARPELGELWIDIGARSQSEAEDHVAVGDVVTFQYEFQKLLGDRAASRAFDNKAGLWAIAEALRLLKEDGGLSPDVSVYAVATVQE